MKVIKVEDGVHEKLKALSEQGHITLSEVIRKMLGGQVMRDHQLEMIYQSLQTIEGRLESLEKPEEVVSEFSQEDW